MIQSQDDTLQTVAFETIGYIGVSLEGKLALVELGNVMTECIDKMGEVIRDSATEMKISAMNALASLVKLDKENQTEQMLTITETWYTRIPNITNTLVNVIKQPFLDLRLEFLFTNQEINISVQVGFISVDVCLSWTKLGQEAVDVTTR